MTPDRVSIVIPALNEAEVIGTVVQELSQHAPGAEILVVDDGCDDDTAEVAAREGARIIRHDRCLGYGAALKTGIASTERDFVLFCDGDGQHAGEDVADLIAQCDEYAMVVGKRTKGSHYPIHRAPGKLVLRWFADLLAGERIPDLNSGLRILRRDVLVKYLHLMPNGFSFSTTCTFALMKANHRIKWIPIRVRERIGASAVRQWKHGPQTLMLMLRISVLFEPLKVFLTVSGMLFLLTIINVTIDLVLSGGDGIGDTSVILSIATLLVFMFGLLCDQVSALRREYHE